MEKYQEMRLAIEAMSGGSNTVLLDDVGLPSIVVGMPTMYLSDLLENAPHDPHPAWIVNGVIRDVIYVSKYMNIISNERGYSLPAQDPAVYFTYDDAHDYCLNKGKGWHLLTNAMWAGIALWSKKNGTIPTGNTRNGESFYYPHEKGIPSSRYGNIINRTATGTGPATWFHNHNVSGIADLTGNIWEWVGGLRSLDGEIQVLPDGRASMYDRDIHKQDGRMWHPITEQGVYSAHGERNTIKTSSPQFGDSVEEDHCTGSVCYDTKVLNRSFSEKSSTGNFGFCESRFCDLQGAIGVDIPLLMKALALYPEKNRPEDGSVRFRNYGERMAVRGGKFDSFDERGDMAGIFALNLYNPRYYHGGSVIGFRSAFVNLDGDMQAPITF